MYNFKKIEKKWQEYWTKNESFKAKDDFSKRKFYSLVEFPYPSGVGMHVGHIKAYMGLEVVSRKKRMEGFNVLFPIGFDAFGLPTENYAIKTNTHPRIVTDRNIEVFTNQLKRVGFSFDFSRTVDTTDEKYYKWTQWIFLKMFEHDLVFQDNAFVNFCPNCKVVLSNEDSQGGKCDICHNDIVQKEKKVWYLRITKYAEKLLEGLKEVDYLPNIKLQQENWIGKSTGAFVNFKIKEVDETLRVYTTRPDTLFGVTFMVIAPEHSLIKNYQSKIRNIEEVKKYQESAKKKTEFERIELNKDKTGVMLDGLTAINPVNNKEIPIYISDYVMMGYGTGAIMAVPAHDERDYAFATKFNIPIIQVICNNFIATDDSKIRADKPFTNRKVVNVLVKHPTENKYLVQKNNKFNWTTFVMGGIENDETVVEAAKRELLEETGYTNLELVKEFNSIYFDNFYAKHKEVNRCIEAHTIVFQLKDLSKKSVLEKESDEIELLWIPVEKLENTITTQAHKFDVTRLISGETAFTGDGIMINSEFLNGLTDKKTSIKKMIEYLEEKNIGEEGIQYKMKDWAFNRQRYWGEPIPIVHCSKCGIVPLPYEELPLVLPSVDNFEPGKNGESPLAKIESFVKCKCPKCNEDALRETDTMPQWAGSSWYFLRYIDPLNTKEFASQEKLKYWLPVDWYNGGMEHVTRHLIYSRFWHQFLYDIGLVPTKEPYAKRTAQGLILGPDGEKMSKSRGNVVDPIEVLEDVGADVLRTYILFMGEYGAESPWNDSTIKGISRFLDRVYNLQNNLNNQKGYTKELEKAINKTIKKVSSDIEEMKFNTAIAELMKLINMYYDVKKITLDDYEILIKLLYPFAPHLMEELNEKILKKDSLVHSIWPTFDEEKTIDDEITIGVQVNGKLRGTITVNINEQEELVKEIAKKEENVQKHILNKEIIKIIVIKNKIVNIVVK